MRRVSNIAAKALLAGTTLALAACGGHGPNSYLMAKDAVVAKLTGAEREFSIGGADKRTIRAVSRNGDTIKVRVSYASGSIGSALCEARVEAINEEWSRVTPVCPKSDSATEIMQAEIDEMQVDEWVLAVLYNREVDSAMVLKRTSAVAIDNINDISKEAAAQLEQAPPASGYTEDGWASSDSDWGN